VCNRLPAGSTVCPGKVVSKGGGTEDAPTGIEFGLSVEVRGGGGSAGDGGAVTLRNEGDIATEGQVAHAIVAHSIGGGGGGGYGGEGASGIQAWTTNETANEIFEDQEKAQTDFSFFTEVKVDVGGAAGASGDGGEVEVVNSGDLTVKGVPEAELATRRASLDAPGRVVGLHLAQQRRLGHPGAVHRRWRRQWRRGRGRAHGPVHAWPRRQRRRPGRRRHGRQVWPD
jgi:hypothetical protein